MSESYTFLQNINENLFSRSTKPGKVHVRFYAYVPYSGIDIKCSFDVDEGSILDRDTHKPVPLEDVLSGRHRAFSKRILEPDEPDRYLLRVGKDSDEMSVRIGGDAGNDVVMKADELGEQYRAGMSAFRVMRTVKEGLNLEDLDMINKIYTKGCIMRFRDEFAFDFLRKHEILNLKSDVYDGYTEDVKRKEMLLAKYGNDCINLRIPDNIEEGIDFNA